MKIDNFRKKKEIAAFLFSTLLMKERMKKPEVVESESFSCLALPRLMRLKILTLRAK